MRHLKGFNESTETPKVSLREFMNGQGIYRWVENPDGSIDFPGDLVMSQYTFDELDFRLESIQGRLTGRVVGLEFGNTPLGQLVEIFGNIKTFQESLDYNYIRGKTRFGTKSGPSRD